MIKTILAVTAAALVLTGPALAQVPRCAPDMTLPGSFCLDRYEASAWSIPPTAASLIRKVQKGRASLADLTVGGATQVGVSSDDYAPCGDNGTGCENVYAVSLAGVTPSAFLTYFQAQQACANALKRLPTSAEWQQTVNGTPDPGPDNGTTDCNAGNTGAVSATGSRSSCVSRFGNFDMVGNLDEWTADWVPLSGACPGWGGFSNDAMCLSGTQPGINPGVILRGGNFGIGFGGGTDAGPLAVRGDAPATSWDPVIGFRCAR